MSLSSQSDRDELIKAQKDLISEYDKLKACNLSLDMSRGNLRLHSLICPTVYLQHLLTIILTVKETM